MRRRASSHVFKIKLKIVGMDLERQAKAYRTQLNEAQLCRGRLLKSPKRSMVHSCVSFERRVKTVETVQRFVRERFSTGLKPRCE